MWCDKNGERERKKKQMYNRHKQNQDIWYMCIICHVKKVRKETHIK